MSSGLAPDFILMKQWRWPSHVLRVDADGITMTVVQWITEGERKRGRPRPTWRRAGNAEGHNPQMGPNTDNGGR